MSSGISKRFKSDNKYNSFNVKIKGDVLVIDTYGGRKKIAGDEVNIAAYLKNGTEYQRRQFLSKRK
jgi:hypothetical protein